jgi:hypothetical protein
MQEETTLMVVAADRPYGEFYDLYSISPEYFGYYHVPGDLDETEDRHLPNTSQESYHLSHIANMFC